MRIGGGRAGVGWAVDFVLAKEDDVGKLRWWWMVTMVSSCGWRW